MVAPLLALGYLGTSLGAVYKVGQAVDNYRYWKDYYKNTGVLPRYRFRSGYYDWMDSTYGTYMRSYGYRTLSNYRPYRRSYRRYRR